MWQLNLRATRNTLDWQQLHTVSLNQTVFSYCWAGGSVEETPQERAKPLGR